MKIALLGSRDLSVKILKWITTTNTDVVGVVCPPFKGWWDDKLRDTANDLGIDTYDDIQKVIDKKPDVIFSINYWKLISKNHIDVVDGKVFNIHHSYRLKYRGRYSTSWAIANGEKYHGTTLHCVTSKLDDGPIVDSRRCIIKDTDTAEDLFMRVEKLAFEMFVDNFYNLLDNNQFDIVPADTNHVYYDKDSNKNLEIQYGISDKKVFDFVRAWQFKDRPRPYFNIGGKKLELYYDK